MQVRVVLVSFTQAGTDSQAPMLQLPHMDMDVIKKLGRKRVRGLGELLDLPEDERLSVLESTGDFRLLKTPQLR